MVSATAIDFPLRAATVGLVFIVTGYVLGLAIAYGIGRKIFSEAAVGVDFGVFMPVMAVTLLVAVIATLLAASRIWRIEPAMILRGE